MQQEVHRVISLNSDGSYIDDFVSQHEVAARIRREFVGGAKLVIVNQQVIPRLVIPPLRTCSTCAGNGYVLRPHDGRAVVEACWCSRIHSTKMSRAARRVGIIVGLGLLAYFACAISYMVYCLIGE